MRDTGVRSNSRARGATWAFVGGTVLGLNLLLHLPALLLGSLPADPVSYLSDPLRFYYLFSLDLFGLVCLLTFVPYSAERSSFRSVVVGSVLFLLAYQAYDALVLSMLHRSPIFYADAPHLVGAVYLLLNAGMPWPHVLGLGVGAGVFVLLAWKLPLLIRHLHRYLRRPSLRRSLRTAAAVIGILVCIGVVTNRGIDRQTYRSVCYSTTECVVRNVRASLHLNHKLARRRSAPADSTYVGYFDLRWQQPPSLYLVMIESYGSVLTRGPDRSSFRRFMTSMADSLAASGWHAATTYSKAPVFGGLSWLSVASVLLGTTVKHQPTFEVLRPTLSRYPHLVALLQQQGYDTATLQPPVRARPGLPVGNPYGFDHTFYLRDLDYRGPSYGWGIVPDQYSLAVAHEQFVEHTDRPFFLFFETATSHSPWNRPPPPLVDDPAALNDARKAASTSPVPPAYSDTRSPIGQLAHHVRYDWRVLVDYLRTQAPPKSLVVVLGDHQPHVADDATLATPLHVLSRDERLIRRFETYGLAPGLLPESAAVPLHHAGVYSMLVRVLTAHDRAAHRRSPRPLPSFHPKGVTGVSLFPNRSHRSARTYGTDVPL